ncbi:MAG: hypoxanthine phosphoribosyltransferase [Verrucomicrobiaceae bacterium]|nr:hypoxanthine phosphoribosyltransferase [Verrucomicrobiaceae bacterium]
MSDLEKVMLEAPVIQNRVAEMAAEVCRDYAGKVITVVAIMDGGLFFVADLLRAIHLPVRLVTMSASSYHGGTKSSGEVKLPWPAGLSLKGEHVLLLDDILDTGLTLGAIQDRMAEEGVASLKTGVLLKKRRVPAREVPVDYVGFEIEDEFVVGYGMDYQARFRNLPCIGILKLT